MAIMIKTIGILMIVSFIAGGVISNYAVSKAKSFIGGNSPEAEIKVSTPIEEIPKDYETPPIDISKAEQVTIIFPSIKYGEVRVQVPLINKC